MGKKKRQVHHHDLRERRSYASAVQVGYRIESERNLSVAVENWYVGYECRHEQLPGDPKPHGCDCWGCWEVTAADEIVAAIVSLTERVDSMLECLERLDDKVNRVDTNVTAVGYQVSKAGDNGR